MPETRPDRLTYARGALEQLRRAHEHLSREELLDLVCHLTKAYVIDQTIPFDVPLPERLESNDLPDVADPQREAAINDPEATPARRFARLIEGLKRRASLPQLDGFAVQDGRAVLIVDNQKVTFGERVTIEFVPVRQAPGAAAPASIGPAATEPAPPPRAPGATPIAARSPGAAPGAAPGIAPGVGAAPASPARPARGAAPFEPDAPARAPRSASPGRPAAQPGARPGAPTAPAAPAPAARREEPRPAAEGGDDVDQSAIERFKRLELD